MRSLLLAAISIAVVTAYGSSMSWAADDSLVTNGTFDSDLTSWREFGILGSREWSPEDGAGATGSGSALLRGRFASLVGRCIPVVGGSDYAFGATRKLTSGFGTSHAIRLKWRGGDGCGVPYLGEETISAAGSSAPADWTTSGQIVTAPSDAASAKISIEVRVRSDDARSSAEASFDDILLALDPCGANCGNPVRQPNEQSAIDPSLITPSDALSILRCAIGVQTCTPCVCDVDADGDITANDALLTLGAAISAAVTVTCPP